MSTRVRRCPHLLTAVGGKGILMKQERLQRQDSVAPATSSADQDESGLVEMEMLGIRELSAPAIEDAARGGRIIGITNDRRLAGVLYPVSRSLPEKLVARNLPQLLERIEQGNRPDPSITEAGTPPQALARPTKSHARRSEILDKSPRVSLRNISGAVLEEAAEANEPITLTTGKHIAGVILPVRADWLYELINQNLPDILSSIEAGEEELRTGEPLHSLDELT
jgi:hypothetical protein